MSTITPDQMTKALQDKGLTTTELARQLGIHFQQVNHVVRGHKSPARPDVLKALGLTETADDDAADPEPADENLARINGKEPKEVTQAPSLPQWLDRDDEAIVIPAALAREAENSGLDLRGTIVVLRVHEAVSNAYGPYDVRKADHWKGIIEVLEDWLYD